MTEEELVSALRRTAGAVDVAPPPTERIVAAGHRRVGWRRAAQIAASVAAAVAVLVPVGVAGRTTDEAVAGSCPAAVPQGVLPEWARTGFSDPEPVMPFVLGERGEIVAIVFGDPLGAPPPPGRSNKILWAVRAGFTSGPFTITARRDQAEAPVVIQSPDGPGPSTVDMPAPGCWRLDLRWPGGTDSLSLHYTAQQPG